MEKLKTMEKLPILGKTYNHYDDGKIKESRLMKSVVTDISEFNDKLLSQEDKEDIVECGFLYSENTDYVIEADLYINEDDIVKVKYVRTLDGRWFSLGWWAGLLDVDNSLTVNLKEYYKKEGVELKVDYSEN